VKSSKCHSKDFVQLPLFRNILFLKEGKNISYLKTDYNMKFKALHLQQLNDELQYNKT